MNRRSSLRYFVALLILTGAMSGWLPAQKKGALKPSVTVVPAAVKPGERFEVKVTLLLPSGFHINSSRPEDEFAIPTDLKMNPASGFALDSPRYPAGKKHTYSYAPQGLTVYEGLVEMAVPIHVQKEVKAGKYSFKGQMRWQPCDASVCYPPEKADIAATVLVK